MRQPSTTWPTGSGQRGDVAAGWRRYPQPLLVEHEAVDQRRGQPFLRPSATSSAFSTRISCARRSSASAMAISARFFSADDATARRREAAWPYRGSLSCLQLRASRPSVNTPAPDSPCGWPPGRPGEAAPPPAAVQPFHPVQLLPRVARPGPWPVRMPVSIDHHDRVARHEIALRSHDPHRQQAALALQSALAAPSSTTTLPRAGLPYSSHSL